MQSPSRQGQSNAINVKVWEWLLASHEGISSNNDEASTESYVSEEPYFETEGERLLAEIKKESTLERQQELATLRQQLTRELKKKKRGSVSDSSEGDEENLQRGKDKQSARLEREVSEQTKAELYGKALEMVQAARGALDAEVNAQRKMYERAILEAKVPPLYTFDGLLSTENLIKSLETTKNWRGSAAGGENVEGERCCITL